MFNGGEVLMTAAFSVIFLKRKLYKHHYLGMFLNILGLSLMGVLTLMSNKVNEGNHSS